MGFVWSWIALPGLLAGAAAFALAAVVYFVRPQRLQNRLLALVLFFEAVAMATGSGLMYLTDSAASTVAWQYVTLHAAGAMVFLYLAFLGTLATPLSAPFRPRAARILLLVAAASYTVVLRVLFGPLHTDVHAWTYAPWNVTFAPATHAGIVWTNGAAFLYGLVVAVDAWRRAQPQSAARAQGRAYLWAFGARDVGYAFVFIGPLAFGPLIGELDLIVLPPIVSVVFSALLAYGILRTQLFDVDLRVKVALKRSTVAAAFIAIFFAASELAAAFFVDRTGSTVVGVVSAALLVFALAPLQRVADRVADTAMPGVRDTPEYLRYRKFEVYRGALESAAVDGEVTAKERDILARLRADLGIAEADADAMERDVFRRLSSPS